jgi:GAF domain-containing protein
VFDVALLRASGRPESLLWLIRDLSTEKALANRANQLAARLVDQDDEDEQHEAAMQLAVNDLASLVLDQVSLSDVLTRVAEVAKTVLPGAAGASVSLFEQGRARVGGTSAPWVAALDERQYTLHEGPCVAALGDGTWHLSSNLDEDTRWLRFGTEATAQGVLSALAVPLLVRGARLGVLNVYGANRDAFPGRAVDDAKRIAETAAVVVANAQMLAASHRLAAELEEALLSRSGVDMAKGMLMARAGVDPDTAFEMLRDLSQRRHVKLRDLAAEMVRSTET